jgi:hypothetical protein
MAVPARYAVDQSGPPVVAALPRPAAANARLTDHQAATMPTGTVTVLVSP